jgi:hypothetical protein
MHARVLPMLSLAVACGTPDDTGHGRPADTTHPETGGDSEADADTDTDTDADLVATIPQIQKGSVPVGTRVEVAGVVVVGSHVPTGFHVADPAGGSTYAGLWVHASPERVGVTVSEGMEVTLEGTTAEYAAVAGDGTLTELDAERVTVTGTAPVPAAIAVDVAALADPATAEPWEGMLLEIGDLHVTVGGDGEWRVDGGFLVDDLYVSTTATTGATLTALRGLLTWTGSEHALEPRSRSDLDGYTEPPWDCRAEICAWDLLPGDLVISEIMRDPEAVADDVGEWFEVTSRLEQGVDLVGLEVTDADGEPAFALPESLVVAPGERVVLGSDPDPWENGGVSPDASYTFSTCALGNGADVLVLAFGGSTVDAVAWDDGEVFPAVGGASMSLDPGASDAVLNDDGARWCSAVTPYGDGDLGTPGEPNDPCLP